MASHAAPTVTVFTAASKTPEAAMKVITGEEALDNFDLFTAQLEKMGVGEALNICRKAYEGHMN